MTTVRALPGLPPYGPLPEPFPSTGMGAHRQGFVVEFIADKAPSWVGNFQRGSTSLDDTLPEPGTERFIVIAGGQAYVVDAVTRSCVRMFGGSIESVRTAPGDMLIFSNGLWMEAYGPSGFLWRSRRISWDGFRNLRVEMGRILGEAYDPTGSDWPPFTVDLTTGDVTGGSYPANLP